MIGHLVVELVTPAMIGGAEAKKCDNPPTLRPPSLRGHLRFWSRALGGELMEEELWGEEKIGQRVQILSVATMRSRGQKVDLKAPERATLLAATEQHGETRLDMIPPGDQVILRFGIPDSVPQDKLKAVLWTWLHLGTVGRRSRRGYGSLQWLPSEGDLLSDWPMLWPSRLKSQKALEEHLEAGLSKVGSICPRPGRQDRQETQSLDTLDQVFVGCKELPGKWEADGSARWAREGESLESIVHGFNENARGAEPDRSQLGSAKPHRLPSPILWRFFPVPGKAAFRPVMTWLPTNYGSITPVKLNRSGEVFRYLSSKFGFETSLTGNPLA